MVAPCDRSSSTLARVSSLSSSEMPPTRSARFSRSASQRAASLLAPRGDSHDIGDSDPKATFGYVARQAGKRGLAFIFTREHPDAPRLTPHLKAEFGGALITNEGLDAAKAQADLDNGLADAVAFGKAYIANPDLVARLRCGAALNPLVPETIYADGALGYTDYPPLAG